MFINASPVNRCCWIVLLNHVLSLFNKLNERSAVADDTGIVANMASEVCILGSEFLDMAFSVSHTV